LTPAFTATIIPPEAGLDLILKWTTSLSGIPGVNVSGLDGPSSIYGYWGTIGATGNDIVGRYGLSPSQVVGAWSATRLSGLGPAIAGITNSASGATGPVAPGEVISIYAHPDTNPIGPTTSASLQFDQGGKVTTTLGGARLHFLPIDVYAPLLYVSAGQINAVVPYEVAGLTSVTAHIEYAGQTSDAVTLQVVSTKPGIFSLDGSGVGPGAILNHDGITINGPNHPEPRGGYIVLYVTGEGQTSPPGVSGKITTAASAPPLTPAPLAGVEVRLNGQSASTSFIGEAPSLVSGVLQINVRVPDTISPGNVPVQVIIGGNPSPTGVTVAVQ
jgi:uncharacterized protein (TIGR03437 family)